MAEVLPLLGSGSVISRFAIAGRPSRKSLPQDRLLLRVDAVGSMRPTSVASGSAVPDRSAIVKRGCRRGR
ncbi:hypothetical protein E2562_027701 [Oryza meyeriana var. granulata]|uniref:Uncharacterized protein n=1 Tax=Oryza meyeriana var. granulata TaxID=110450 RepID=A0A6G1CTA9_9ORYZ|nr:hypothetical protein E2562_027701 [Oryza meyeriana var. granulata]